MDCSNSLGYVTQSQPHSATITFESSESHEKTHSTFSMAGTPRSNISTTSRFHFDAPLSSHSTSSVFTASKTSNSSKTSRTGSTTDTPTSRAIETHQTITVPGVAILVICIGAAVLIAVLVLLTLKCWKQGLNKGLRDRRRIGPGADGPPLLARAMQQQQAEYRLWYGNFYGGRRRPGAARKLRDDKRQQMMTGNFYGRDLKYKLEKLEEGDCLS